MQQVGEHNWQRYLHYHRCPACGYVFENRSDYVLEGDQAVKALQCPRCAQTFKVAKPNQAARFPLFGRPQPVEIEWE